MKTIDKSFKKRIFIHFALVLSATLLTVTGEIPISKTVAQDISAPNRQNTDSSQKIQLMFVQTAETLKIDPTTQTLRLINVNPQTLYFADRPQRIAGHITLPAYMDEWTAQAGANNFANDPPNATLSVYEGKNQENSLVVIEISNPVIEGKDIIYNYKLINGTIPKQEGATALFIDWIGVGGGVGPGFHGVGAGTRGVGLTGGYGGPAR
ncbi:hypothetical protein PCC7424_3833 [Gloeothece citriformis PCC 7424]|uniref:Uncharacterized protein n=1 Tax=Gloeothece citriformis (strain PCC 7424) TaxID=65393 RepID=B7KJD0_GLOC7|nr:hypothetical protein [Gloeothece citriformis]ACK72214.1 hypothetical protein PCC7424_3833 [Gloeothece citriformis PCC 7424]